MAALGTLKEASLHQRSSRFSEPDFFTISNQQLILRQREDGQLKLPAAVKVAAAYAGNPDS
jgi:hypothetical protein